PLQMSSSSAVLMNVTTLRAVALVNPVVLKLVWFAAELPAASKTVYSAPSAWSAAPAGAAGVSSSERTNGNDALAVPLVVNVPSNAAPRSSGATNGSAFGAAAPLNTRRNSALPRSSSSVAVTPNCAVWPPVSVDGIVT